MNSAIVNMSFHQESNMNISKINIASADGNIAIYDIHSDKIIYDYQFSTQLTNILSNNSTIILPSNTGKISIYNIPNIQGVTNSINQKESIEDYRISCRQVFKKMFDVFKIYIQSLSDNEQKEIRNISEEYDNSDGLEQLSISPVKIPHLPKLLYCFNHKQSVILSTTNKTNELLFTASMDCTIKIWSLLLGKLLYTFELPEPVNGLDIMQTNSNYEGSECYYIYCSCYSCLIILSIYIPNNILEFKFDVNDKYTLSLVGTITSKDDLVV